MKNSKQIIPCLFLVFITFNFASGQVIFEVPKNVEYKTPADYTKYEPQLIEAAKWLEETDYDKESEKRKEVNFFVLQWISGSPTVSMELTEKLTDITKANDDLLAVYMASYVRNCIETKNPNDKFSATKAGLISIMKVYNKKLGIAKNKEMEYLIRLTNENKLDGYVKSIIGA